jgi:hypothetical protein
MYEDLKERIKKELEAAQNMLLAVETLPELEGNVLPHPSHNTILSGMPNNREFFQVNRARLEAAGWQYKHTMTNKNDGNLIVDFWNAEYSIEFTMILYPDMPGATCKRNLIGYEQKPIYEVTCMDAEPLL